MVLEPPTESPKQALTLYPATSADAGALTQLYQTAWNDPAENAVAAAALAGVFGEEALRPPEDPLPASDDFSRYAERHGIPSVIWNFGVQDPALHAGPVPAPRNHDARFAPHPTGAVEVGIAAAVAVLTARLAPAVAA